MTCDVEVDEAVDSGVSVSTSWRGPSGGLASNSRVTISKVNVSDSEHYQSEVMISSLQSSDSGNYTCGATISPEPSAFIQESDNASDVIHLSVGKHVMFLYVYRIVLFYGRIFLENFMFLRQCMETLFTNIVPSHLYYAKMCNPWNIFHKMPKTSDSPKYSTMK